MPPDEPLPETPQRETTARTGFAGRWLPFLGTVMLVYLLIVGVNVMTERPDRLRDKLAPCPNSPNCVSSQAEDAEHQIAPLVFQGSAAEAKQRLKDALARFPRMKIVAETDATLQVEATSFLFRFVDDVEFMIDEAAGVIHFRSASRVGYSDLGANRTRMERIRAAFAPLK